MTIKESTSMKTLLRLFAGLGALVILAGVIRAGIVYNANLVNDPALAKNNTYSLNLATVPNAAGIQYLSAQAIYSSTTASAASFTDGRVSTGSITVLASGSLSAANATNQITVAPTATILAASATNYLVVLVATTALNGKTVTYNGNPLVGGVDWFVQDTSSGTAESIKTAINRFNGVHATRTNDEVDMTVTSAGAVGNAKTLAVNTSSITIGGAHFGGGYNNRIVNAYFTLNGLRYGNNSGWSAQDTSTGTARSIAAWLNRQSGIRASSAASVVYATATVAGTAGNSFTLASSAPSYMTVAAATFLGGRNNAQVCINGTCVTQGTNWTAADTSSGTAKAISDAIMAKSALTSILSSTWTSGGVVTATTTATGTATAYAMTTNVPASLTLSNAAMQGGRTSAWVSNTSPITLPAHGLGTGYGVTFSTGSGVRVAPLVPDTVYYVAKIDANTIALSTTSAGAIAGSYIVLGAAATTGPHTFTLTPQAISGTASFKWQASNDCSNWFDLGVSSLSFASSYTAGTTSWDFGRVNYKCVRVNELAPTTGAWNLQVSVTGSN